MKQHFRKKKIVHKYTKAILIICLLLVVSGVASFFFYSSAPWLSSFLTSTSAGCLTGIVFFILANMRTNEISNMQKECQYLTELREQLTLVQTVCFHLLEENVDENISTQTIKEVVEKSKKCVTKIATLCFNCPVFTKLIGDFPDNYLEEFEYFKNAIHYLNTLNESEIDQQSFNENISCIISFCLKTDEMLWEPLIEIMIDISSLERSKL